MIDLWEKIDGRVGELMEGVEPLPDSMIPFDAASDEPMEEQKWVDERKRKGEREGEGNMYMYSTCICTGSLSIVMLCTYSVCMV